MNLTQNYALKQWEGSDRILRSDFNENNQAIEAALDAKQANIDALDVRIAANAATLNAHDTKIDSHDATLASHTSTLNSHAGSINSHTSLISNLTNTTNTNATNIANLTSEVDTLQGKYLRLISGTYAGDGTKQRVISFGTEVSLIFVWGHTSEANLNTSCAFLPASGFSYSSSMHDKALVHNGSSFTISNDTWFNSTGRTYYYAAIRVGD